jgi:hypothetical protein
MPDINALYPQPPTGGLANMGIGQVVDVARGLQDLDRAKFELDQKRLGMVSDLIGSQAQNPNLNKKDLASWVANISRMFPNLPLASGLAILNDAPERGPGLQQAATNLAKVAVGSHDLNLQRFGVTPATGEAPYTIPAGTAMNVGGGGVGGGGGAPGVSAPQAAGGALPGALPAGLPAGGPQSVERMTADRNEAINYGQDMIPLQQAHEFVQKLKQQYGSGYFDPGSKGRQDFEAFIHGISPQLAKSLGISEDKLANFAIADKYIKQAVASRVGGFGQGTQEQLKLASGGSPSTEIPDMATEHVLKMMIAARRMQHAQFLASSTGGPVGYADLASRISGQLHPGAFMADLSSPKELASVNSSLKDKADRDRYNTSMLMALQSGMYTRDQLKRLMQPAQKTQTSGQ